MTEFREPRFVAPDCFFEHDLLPQERAKSLGFRLLSLFCWAALLDGSVIHVLKESRSCKELRTPFRCGRHLSPQLRVVR